MRWQNQVRVTYQRKCNLVFDIVYVLRDGQICVYSANVQKFALATTFLSAPSGLHRIFIDACAALVSVHLLHDAFKVPNLLPNP